MLIEIKTDNKRKKDKLYLDIGFGCKIIFNFNLHAINILKLKLSEIITGGNIKIYIPLV